MLGRVGIRLEFDHPGPCPRRTRCPPSGCLDSRTMEGEPSSLRLGVRLPPVSAYADDGSVFVSVQLDVGCQEREQVVPRVPQRVMTGSGVL